MKVQGILYEIQRFVISYRNAGKVKVLCYVLCVEVVLVLHMEEKMISIDTRITQSIRDVDVIQQQRKLSNFGISSANAKLNQKVVKG